MPAPTRLTAMATRTRPAVRPEALREAAPFPTLEAIFTRRARRFALGAELTGPLAYRSEKEPVPLAYEEEAILVAAATGVTGVVAEEWPFLTEEGGPTGRRQARLVHRTRLSEPARASTAPSSSGRTTTASSFSRSATRGPTRTSRTRRSRRSTPSTADAIKLQDGRLDIPRRRPNLFRFNEWIVNTRGLDALHPGLGRHPAVHLGDAPLLRPPARLLPGRPAARRRPAAAVREVGAARRHAPRRPVGLRALADGRHERRRGRPDGAEPDARHAGARDSAATRSRAARAA